MRPDDGPSTPVRVTPDDFHRAAQTFADCSSDMVKLRDQLWLGLGQAAGWGGVDRQAVEFGNRFSDALTSVLMGFVAAAQVLADIASGIDLAARNHWRADQAATPGGAADPPWPPIDSGLILNAEPQHFPMTGNATHRLPGYLQAVVPLGDPTRLWTAAHTFTEIRDDLDATIAALHSSLASLFTNNASEDLTALDEFWNRIGGLSNDRAILTALRNAVDQLGRALDEFANWIKNTQDQILDAVTEVIKDALIGILAGLALAAITEGIGGLGDLLAVVDAAGEGGAIVAAVTGVLSATNVTGPLAAVGGTVGGVIGIMNVAIENTPRPNLDPTNPPQLTDDQLTTDAATTTGHAARAEELPETKYPERQLQKKFKHAHEFGVDGNWNSTTANEYQQVLEKFAKDPANTLKHGTYRGEPATLIYNEESGLCEVLRPDGTYWTGWRLTDQQMKYLIERGTLGGDA